MNPITQLLRTRSFWIGFAVVFGIQFVCLLLTTPLYELDTNSYIQGALSWSIYHNPYLNLFIGVFSKVWSNAWFIVSVQVLQFAFAVTFLSAVLFGRGRGFWVAMGVAALEPITMFYNFSLISESSFCAFILLSVAFLVLYFREKTIEYAIGFGVFLGMALLSRLAAMPLIALFGLFLLQRELEVPKRLLHLVAAVVPFVAFYFFIQIGQSVLNEGALYTVKGRVLFDFCSSQYDPEEIDEPHFEKTWNPFLFREGTLVAERELRREMSNLAYKQCIADQESAGRDANLAIQSCDSPMGVVGAKILRKHPVAAEWQFIKDNIKFVHTQSFMEYRFTEGILFYPDPAEYVYLDSLMSRHYGVNLAENKDQIPRIWRDLSFSNVYMPILYWAHWAAVMFLLISWLRDRSRYEYLILGAVLLLPIAFHLVYVSYRLRFLAPYELLMILSWVWAFLGKKND